MAGWLSRLFGLDRNPVTGSSFDSARILATANELHSRFSELTSAINDLGRFNDAIYQASRGELPFVSEEGQRAIAQLQDLRHLSAFISSNGVAVEPPHVGGLDDLMDPSHRASAREQLSSYVSDADNALGNAAEMREMLQDWSVQAALHNDAALQAGNLFEEAISVPGLPESSVLQLMESALTLQRVGAEFGNLARSASRAIERVDQDMHQMQLDIDNISTTLGTFTDFEFNSGIAALAEHANHDVLDIDAELATDYFNPDDFEEGMCIDDRPH